MCSRSSILVIVSTSTLYILNSQTQLGKRQNWLMVEQVILPNSIQSQTSSPGVKRICPRWDALCNVQESSAGTTVPRKRSTLETTAYLSWVHMGEATWLNSVKNPREGKPSSQLKPGHPDNLALQDYEVNISQCWEVQSMTLWEVLGCDYCQSNCAFWELWPPPDADPDPSHLYLVRSNKKYQNTRSGRWPMFLCW